MSKATCLSLLSNTVLVWNTVHMTRIIAQLRATGETIADEDVARISPAAFAHVIPNGTYVVRPTPLEREENREEALGLLENEGNGELWAACALAERPGITTRATASPIP